MKSDPVTHYIQLKSHKTILFIIHLL